LNWAARGTRPKRRDGVPSHRSGVEWVRVSAPPSIPAPSQSYGYEENERGELVLQRPTRAGGHTGTGNDHVGPGEYLSRTHEHPFSHERKKGFVEWSRSATHRVMNVVDHAAAAAPGSVSLHQDV
jgi:hypothetical protein